MIDKLAQWSTEREWRVDADPGRLAWFDKERDKPPVVTFRFEKANAWDGWRIFEKLRAQVASSPDLRPEAFTSAVIGAIGRLEPAFVLALAADMFEYVGYNNTWRGSSDFVPVKGAEESAFEGLEPVVVYEVVGRALAVNFTRSLSGLLSKVAEPTDQSASTR